jgi:hypothetical protein
MEIEVCQPKRAQASTLENFQVVFQVWPKFCFCPTCQGTLGFSFRAHLPGSRADWRLNYYLKFATAAKHIMVQDTSELRQGSATAKPGRLGVTQGSAAAAGETVSPSLDSTGKESFTTNLSFQGPSLAEPTWASGKFKSIMCYGQSRGRCGASARRHGLTPARRYCSTPV